MDNLTSIIESLLFVSETPLTVEKIDSVLALGDRKAVRDALITLGKEYDEQQRAFFLSEVAGGYQLRTRPQYAEWARKLKQSKPLRMSRAAMETLAIIAYKQPVIRTDVEYLRGVDCGGVLRMLLEKGVLRVLGRKDLPGRPIVYGTSKRFLEIFDLKDLKNLPTLKEIQELGEISPSDSYDDVEDFDETPPEGLEEARQEIEQDVSKDSDNDINDLVDTPPEDAHETEELGEAWQNDSN